MFEMKRDFLRELMCSNAVSNAFYMGFTQVLFLSRDDVVLRRSDGSEAAVDKDSLDSGKKTMILCEALTETELDIVTCAVSAFPEGSQAVFCHGFSKERCYEILSAHGIKIFEHIDLNAVVRQFGEETDEEDNLYYCLAVKI